MSEKSQSSKELSNVLAEWFAAQVKTPEYRKKLSVKLIKEQEAAQFNREPKPVSAWQARKPYNC